MFVFEQDLQQEIEYFQIPYFARQIDLALKRGAKFLDEFGDSLEALLIEATSIVINRIEINFCQRGYESYLRPFIMNIMIIMGYVKKLRLRDLES